MPLIPCFEDDDDRAYRRYVEMHRPPDQETSMNDTVYRCPKCGAEYDDPPVADRPVTTPEIWGRHRFEVPTDRHSQ